MTCPNKNTTGQKTHRALKSLNPFQMLSTSKNKGSLRFAVSHRFAPCLALLGQAPGFLTEALFGNSLVGAFRQLEVIAKTFRQGTQRHVLRRIAETLWQSRTILYR